MHRRLGSISHLGPKTWKNTNPSIYYEMHLFFFSHRNKSLSSSSRPRQQTITCSKSIIEALEKGVYRYHFRVSVVNFEHISHLFAVFTLLILSTHLFDGIAPTILHYVTETSHLNTRFSIPFHYCHFHFIKDAADSSFYFAFSRNLMP